MRPILKRGLHYCGSALAIVGIVFVLLRLRDYGSEIDLARFGMLEWSAALGLAMIYGLANLTLAFAWWNLLGQLGAGTSRRCAVRIYGISQIARYVPGNIFQLAGRQALGMAAGLPASALAKSALWELGLIAVAGAIFGLLAAPLMWSDLTVSASTGAFCAIAVGAFLVLRRLLSPSVSVSLVWQIIFLATSGAVFMGALALVSPSAVSHLTFTPLCGAYVIAWLVGLVTPGAPAGLGVRELVLLFLIGGRVEQADLFLAIVLGRLVTVGGDFLFFAAAASAFRGIKV
jgi:glycosyltransferase 2 family protein